MNKRSLISLTVFALMVIFIYSTVSAQAVQPPKAGRVSLCPQVLKDALQLTPEQERKFEEFRQARLAEARAHREKMVPMRDELKKLIADPGADEQKINDLIDQMSRLRADRMKALYKNRKAWEKIFTPEQLKKLEGYRQDFRLRREWQGGQRGRRGGLMMKRGDFDPGSY
ncbi:MAG: Spy/CpxP family protein refolding chaperone [Acidobacteriota bacterium]|nr:Spy/CpxP family protein refolding chaperone [Acidobacteriota bacterium]